MANVLKTMPAQDTPLQRLTCKWLSVSTAGVSVAVAMVALLAPADFYSSAVRFDLLHSATTAGLLYWGWRGATLGRYLAGLGIAAGLLHMAPLLFFGAFLVV